MGTEVGTGAAAVHRRRQLLPFVLPSLTSSTSAVLRGGPCSHDAGVLGMVPAFLLKITAVGRGQDLLPEPVNIVLLFLLRVRGEDGRCEPHGLESFCGHVSLRSQGPGLTRSGNTFCWDHRKQN